MKKYIFILFCLPLILSSCQEDDLTPSSAASPPSSPCGNATVTVNGTTLSSYSPIMNPAQLGGGCPDPSFVVYINTSPSSLLVSLVSDPTGGLSFPEWTVSGEILNYTGGIISPTTLYSPDYPERDIVCYFSSFSPAENYTNCDIQNDPTALQNRNAIMTITNIDLANKLISGEFEFTGYLLAPGAASAPTKNIHCVFSDIPFKTQ